MRKIKAESKLVRRLTYNFHQAKVGDILDFGESKELIWYLHHPHQIQTLSLEKLPKKDPTIIERFYQVVRDGYLEYFFCIETHNRKILESDLFYSESKKLLNKLND